MGTDKVAFEVVERDGDCVHMCGFFPRFYFLTIVVVQNVGTRDRMSRYPVGGSLGGACTTRRWGFPSFFLVFWPDMTLPIGGSLGCAHAQPEVGVSRTFSFYFFFIFFLFFFSTFFHNTCLTSSNTSFSSPFPGYLPAMFMGSTFHNYISYKS
jgi:hypothetical protein